MEQQYLNPELVLSAYMRGLFPMADTADSREIYWYDPDMRGQLSISHLHVPRRLRKTVRQNPYDIGFNYDFSGVINGCAKAGPGRQETWINAGIREAFKALHRAGAAHSVEAWYKGKLVGGIYGLAIGGAFFGESMYSDKTDASKICLVHLCAHLKKQGFVLLDTQFINQHLKQFGVYELPRDEYLERLNKALKMDVSFISDQSYDSSSSSSSSEGVSVVSSDSFDSSVSFPSSSASVAEFLQSITQTS